MAYAPFNPLPVAERSEQLARLAYELLDAHADTERLAHGRASRLQWDIHLAYLRDLQRVGREILAEAMSYASPDGR